MKILVIGDPHFRFELPYSSSFADGRKSEWADVKSAIQMASADCDEIVLMGDNLNSRHNHSSVIREFIEFLQSFGEKKVHILIGNHERYGINTALDFLKEFNSPNWAVYKDVVLSSVGGKPAMMVPYITPGLLGVKSIEEASLIIHNLIQTLATLPNSEKLLFFTHHGVMGAKSHGIGMEMFNEVIIKKDILDAYAKFSFFGHIHQKQTLAKDIIGTGNIFSNEAGDHSKSVYKLDVDTLELEEVSLPVRGIYKIENPTIDGLKSIPKTSIVKCVLTKEGLNTSALEDELKKFDASMLIEQYGTTRSKFHYDKNQVLDFSIETMLGLYAEAKKVPLQDLKEALEILQSEDAQ